MGQIRDDVLLIPFPDFKKFAEKKKTAPRQTVGGLPADATSPFSTKQKSEERGEFFSNKQSWRSNKGTGVHLRYFATSFTKFRPNILRPKSQTRSANKTEFLDSPLTLAPF